MGLDGVCLPVPKLVGLSGDVKGFRRAGRLLLTGIFSFYE